MNFSLLGVIFVVANFGAYIIPLFPCRTGLVEAVRIPLGALFFVLLYLMIDAVVYYFVQDAQSQQLAIEDL